MLTSIAQSTLDKAKSASQPVRGQRLVGKLIAASAMLLLCGSAVAQHNARQPDKPSSAGKARAEPAYPDRPIRLVVPLAVGGAVDTVARVIGPYLAESLGQQIIVDNRPGAGGVIGVEIAAKATPDGYTLLMYDNSITVMPSIFKALPFDPAKDFVPVGSVSSVPFVLVVNASAPYKSVGDLIAAARSRPGQLNYGSAGIGSPPHLAPELLAAMSGVTFTHVPFKGAPQALTEVMAGRVEFMFVSMPLAKPQIEAGRIRGLAVSTSKRAAALPNLPTVDEAGAPRLHMSLWYGFWAPAGTPAPVIARLEAAVQDALADADVRARLTGLGMEIPPRQQQNPESLAAQQKADIEKWWPIIKAAGIKQP